MNIGMVFRRLAGKVSSIIWVNLSKLLKRRGFVCVLHSVGDTRHPYNLSTANFEILIKSLRDVNVIPINEWEKRENFVSLSFDDVPVSFYYNAFPLLKKYDIPFTLFVSCSLLDEELYITTEMLKEISNCDLCTIGSHGLNHVFFADYSKEEAIDDLKKSKSKLESIINKDVTLYAFPYGSLYACGYNNRRMVKKVYQYGFGTIATAITKPLLFPVFYLPRVGFTDDSFEKRLKTILQCKKK